MNEERIEYIKEKVNMRNMANVMCGYNTDKTDNEILELIYGIEKLQQENKQLKDLYRKTCEHLFNIGNDELARYFQAQINECPTFTTQILGSDK